MGKPCSNVSAEEVAACEKLYDHGVVAYPYTAEVPVVLFIWLIYSDGKTVILQDCGLAAMHPPLHSLYITSFPKEL